MLHLAAGSTFTGLNTSLPPPPSLLPPPPKKEKISLCLWPTEEESGNSFGTWMKQEGITIPKLAFWKFWIVIYSKSIKMLMIPSVVFQFTFVGCYLALSWFRKWCIKCLVCSRFPVSWKGCKFFISFHHHIVLTSRLSLIEFSFKNYSVSYCVQVAWSFVGIWIQLSYRRQTNWS